MPRSCPGGREMHDGKARGRHEFGSLKGRGGRSKGAGFEWEQAVFEMRTTGGVQEKADVFQGHDHRWTLLGRRRGEVSGAGGGGDISMGNGGGDGGLAAIGIGRVNLNESMAEVTEFDADGAEGSGDNFFFATESSSFDPFKAKTEGGGFAKNNGGESFGVRGQGEDSEEVAGATFFHEEGHSRGVEGAGMHETIEGVSEVLAGDIVEVGTNFHDGVRRKGRGGALPEEGTEDIGAIGKVAGAEAVADFFSGKRVERSEFLDELGEDGGAGGGGKFVGDVELAERDAAKDFGGGGGGERKSAVSALDGAGTIDGNGGGDGSEVEVVQAGGGANKVNDGVDRADFVKVDGIDGDAVELGFGGGDTLEQGEGGVAHEGGEFRFLEKVADFCPVAAMRVGVRVGVIRFVDKKARAREAAAESAFGLQGDFFGEGESGDGILVKGEGHA